MCFAGKEFRAMFISTVRTRHLMDATHVQKAGLTDIDGDCGDFGFLSDSKLLNTALTRTQAAVVVVGDPVALCAIGECSKVWQTYLKHCQNMGSLFPQNHNLESIRQQVQNLVNSPAREKLLQVANEHQSSHRHNNNQAALTSQKSQDYNSVRNQNQSYNLLSSAATDITPPTYTGNSSQVNGIQYGVQSLTLGAQTNAGPARSPLAPLNPLKIGVPRSFGPAPLNPLANKMEPCYKVGEEFSLVADEVLAQLSRMDSCGRVGRGGYEVKEENGYAVPVGKNDQPGDGAVYYPFYTEQQLRSMLADSSKYVRCTLYISNGQFYLECLPDKMRIDVSCRSSCGAGNNKDEVVAETLMEGGQIYGKVVGVLKRAVDTKSQYIVCKKGDNSGVMIPVNEGLSPMFSVTSQSTDCNISVYLFTKTKKLKFSHQEKISSTEIDTKYFVVRFLKYESKLRLPLCIVVGTLPADTSVGFGIKVLDLQFQMSKSSETIIAAEIDDLYPSNLTNQLMSTGHEDLTDRWCFTIDMTGQGVNSHAFSIDQKSDSYEVGVHVADVAAFVRKNSSVDIEARRRGITAHPVQDTPSQLLRPTAHPCNFNTGENRLAISVLLTVKSTGELTKVKVSKTVINSKKDFTLKEAEEVIHDPYAQEDYMKSCILVLSQISSVWRRDRLGNATLYDGKAYNKVAPFTQQLVEELVVITQQHIAQVISTKFPDATPMLIQEAPDPQKLEMWKRNHAADAVNSIALTKPFLNYSAQESCRCDLACTHIVNYVRRFNITKREHIDVISKLWDSLNESVSIGDSDTTQNIIISAENHPQIAVALTNLTAIDEAEKFVCSSDVSTEQWFNYTLNCKPYTSFTDTLSSYLDIVVQRLLVACLDNEPCPYSHTEIQTICAEGTLSLAKKRTYELESFLLQLSVAMLSRPLILQPLITDLNSESVELCFPDLPCVNNIGRINVASLGVCEVLGNVAQGSNVQLKWQERVYDVGVLSQQIPIGSSCGELNPDRFIYKIPAFQWQRLLIAIRQRDEETRKHKLKREVEVVGKQVVNPALEACYIDDVTSEVQKNGKIKHIAEFTMKLHTSQVLMVQVSARIHNALLTPYIQLLNLTNSLDICLQHREYPETSFVKVSSAPIVSIDAPCTDIASYQRKWSVPTEIEAVTRAVSSSDRLVINNVILDWKPGNSGKTIATAELTLPIRFMKERLIKLTSNYQQEALFSKNNAAYCKAFFSDFLCVRYSGLSFPGVDQLCDSLTQVINRRSTHTWVGHCIVADVVAGSSTLTLTLELVQSDVPLPVSLIKMRSCTVELIMRTERDR